MEQNETLKRMIGESRQIVFFGGAGVSTESGIPDFRSADGLYKQKWRYPPETIVSHTFFMEHPEEFFAFYREKMLAPDARPNAAHKALAHLEAEGKLTAVVTQNIDGLHQAAGSKNVLELHGSVHRNHCMRCGKFYDLRAILDAPGVPVCSCGGAIKPDVVLYEEQLDETVLMRAVEALSEADLLIVGGTSLAVYPAAGLVRYCKGRLAVINMSPTPLDAGADLLIQAPIGETLKEF
ncbi:MULTISPECIES: NAD-dependent protein deacylase [Anaerotruncus]|jgi:NAD-dependent deacetylase|uniref:NAD-dependent protein deacetylase n=1 Tax=Anaerotruncus colihominis TaxID=169435 RepID=A0A845RIC5_9FIRM|nr:MULTISPECIES: NAD-dependent protein deacylase [Anaerotruncus]MCI8492198.1 NAD-dependent protein deacylase [Anaerotruncus sp.]MCR2026198.1 NAD-dependent protein deacylase [Anaerotruncus colihominis]NBI78688.1 NAD-dependent protein deacylase [Anaerotruncus colihominis]NDO38324.1 NAD-dependent protein deacylase [Anaerotruncus colihominis]